MRRANTVRAGLLALIALVISLHVGNASAGAQATNPYGEYTPLTPLRIFDSRNSAALGTGQSIDIPVTSTAGVPEASQVAAVVVNLTGVTGAGHTAITLSPADGAVPVVSNLNLVPFDVRANLAIVKTSADGRIRITSLGPDTHVVLDLQGYFSSATGPFGSRFHSTDPLRVLDTRSGFGPIGGERGLRLTLAGRSVPAGATAVALNLTAIAPTSATYVTVYPAAQAPPLASNINLRAGDIVPNMVVVPLGAGGAIDMVNVFGTVDLAADLVGWFDGDKGTEAGRFVPLPPRRVVDSRLAGTQGRIGPPGYFWIDFGSNRIGGPTLGIGDGVGAMVSNLTVTQPDSPGYAVVYPGHFGNVAPLASSLNFSPNQTVPNLTIVPLGTGPNLSRLHLWISNGTTYFILDISGYFTNANAVL